MTTATPLIYVRIALLVSLALRCTAGQAVGLGPMKLQSALGQPLRASVQVLGSDARSLAESCLRSRLSTADGTEILRPQIELRRNKPNFTEISLTSTESVEEPAVTLRVEVTCTPTLNRDYQLLLDLKDGLPRVISKDDLSASVPSAPRAVAKRTDDDAAESAQRRRRRALRDQDGAQAPGAADGDNLTLISQSEPPKARAKGLPGARNVLKLSQEDMTFGVKPGASSLKLSDTLSVPADQATASAADIMASKARFLAMMKGEDPLVLAQTQVRTLQTRLQQIATDPAARTTGTEGRVLAPATFGMTPLLNKWLIGFAVLLVAAVGMVAMVFRLSKRPADTSTTPWWQAASDAASREAELLQAARNSVEKKTAPVQEAAPVAVELSETERLASQDKALQRYVEKFVSKEGSAGEVRAAPTAPTAPPELPPAVAPEFTAAPVEDDAFATESHHDGDSLVRNRANLATFELVFDVMQEAEFWKMLNETQRAIDILENYCNEESPLSPVPWLYLAELYQSRGDFDRREKLRERFSKLFNTRFDEPHAPGEVMEPTLEDYPHVLDRISALWGNHVVVPFMQGLLVNDREAPREGFHLPVYREIMLLIDVAIEREQVAA